MRKTEKGDNSVMDFENFTRSKAGHHTLDTRCDPNIMVPAEAVFD